MPRRTTATKHMHEQLIRTKTGSTDDTIYADGATVPSDDDCWEFSAKVPEGKGYASHIELSVLSVNSSGVVQARGSCTFDLRIVRIIDREYEQPNGESWAAVACATEPITGQSLQSVIRVPFNGGKIYVGFENVASAPAGHAEFQVWGKAVAG